MLRTFSTTLSSSGKKLSSAYRGDWFGTTDASGISRWWRVLPQDGCAPGSSHRSACVQDVCKNQQTWGLPLGCIRVGDSYYDFVGCLTVLALGNPTLASPKNSLAASCCTVRFDPQASGCAHCWGTYSRLLLHCQSLSSQLHIRHRLHTGRRKADSLNGLWLVTTVKNNQTVQRVWTPPKTPASMLRITRRPRGNRFVEDKKQSKTHTHTHIWARVKRWYVQI